MASIRLNTPTALLDTPVEAVNHPTAQSPSAPVTPAPAAEAPDGPLSLQDLETKARGTTLTPFSLDTSGPGSGPGYSNKELKKLKGYGGKPPAASPPTSGRNTVGARPPFFAVERVKTRLYRPEGRENLNLNCKVNLSTNEIDSHGDKTVRCRHLAVRYTQTPKKDDFFNAIKCPKGIITYFSGGGLRSANEICDQKIANATLRNACVVSVEAFPGCLIEVAQYLKAHGESTAELLLTSNNHVMAMSIKIKDPDQDRVCVTVYDPNNTTNHWRVEARLTDPKELEQILVPLEQYRKQGSHAFTVHGDHNYFKPECAFKYLVAGSKSTRAKILTSSIYLALDRMDPALLEQLIETAEMEHRDEGYDLTKVLAATQKGISGLKCALKFDKTPGISAYIKAATDLAVRRLLTSDELNGLLNPPSPIAHNLFPSTHGKDPATLRAYLEGVTKAAALGALETAHVKQIFSARDVSNTPGLNFVWRNCDTPSLKIVVEQLGTCHASHVFNGNDIKELLQAQVPDNKVHDNNKPLINATREQVKSLKEVLNPLVEQGALKESDVKTIFATLGVVDKSFKTTLRNLFH